MDPKDTIPDLSMHRSTPPPAIGADVTQETFVEDLAWTLDQLHADELDEL